VQLSPYISKATDSSSISQIHYLLHRVTCLSLLSVPATYLVISGSKLDLNKLVNGKKAARISCGGKESKKKGIIL
jgi:hypothetical protein